MLHKTNVPDNVHLLTLEQWEAGTVFITSFPLQSVSFSFSPLFLSLFPINVCSVSDCYGIVAQWSSMKRPLPDNVHLLTLEQWEAGDVLLRLEHFYAKDEDPVLSQPAKIQLKVCVFAGTR